MNNSKKISTKASTKASHQVYSWWFSETHHTRILFEAEKLVWNAWTKIARQGRGYVKRTQSLRNSITGGTESDMSCLLNAIRRALLSCKAAKLHDCRPIAQKRCLRGRQETCLLLMRMWTQQRWRDTAIRFGGVHARIWSNCSSGGCFCCPWTFCRLLSSLFYRFCAQACPCITLIYVILSTIPQDVQPVNASSWIYVSLMS